MLTTAVQNSTAYCCIYCLKGHVLPYPFPTDAGSTVDHQTPPRDDDLIRDLLARDLKAPSIRVRRDSTPFSEVTYLQQKANVRQTAADLHMPLFVGNGYSAISQFDIVTNSNTYLIDRE